MILVLDQHNVTVTTVQHCDVSLAHTDGHFLMQIKLKIFNILQMNHATSGYDES